MASCNMGADTDREMTGSVFMGVAGTLSAADMVGVYEAAAAFAAAVAKGLCGGRIMR